METIKNSLSEKTQKEKKEMARDLYMKVYKKISKITATTPTSNNETFRKTHHLNHILTMKILRNSAKKISAKTKDIDFYTQKDLYDDIEDYRSGYDQDKKEIEQILKFAQEKHHGQTRDEGTQYFSHIENVYQYALENKLSHYNLAIAILHDTLEDTKTTYEELHQLYGKFVADGVLRLTKVKNKEFTLEQYLKDIVNDPNKYLPVIKVLDRLDNIKSLNKCPNKEKVKRYIDETEKIFIPIMEKSQKMQLPKYNVLLEEIKELIKNEKNV